MRTVVLCVLLLDTNATATGLRGLGWSKRPIEVLRGFSRDKLADMSNKAKQLGASLLLAGIVTCSTTPCVADEITHILPKTEATNITHNLYQVTAELEQIIEDGQIDIIEIADQHLLAVEIDNGTIHLDGNGTVSLQLSTPHHARPIDWSAMALAIGAGLLVFVPPFLLIPKGTFEDSYGYWTPLSILVAMSGFTVWGVYYGMVYL